jgi:hypothetical protein
MAFLLFFSEVDIANRFIVIDQDKVKFDSGSTKFIINSSEIAHSSDIYKYPNINNTRDEVNREWWGYFSFVDQTVGAPEAHFYVHPYTQLLPVGPAISSSGMAIKDLSSIDATKSVVESVSAGQYQVYFPLQGYAFCFSKGGISYLLGFPNNASPAGKYDIQSDNDVCNLDIVRIVPGKYDIPMHNIFRVRSVYSMIQYLGEVLRWQTRNPSQCISGHVPPGFIKGCEGDEIFRLNVPDETPVVELMHRTEHYSLGKGKTCLEVGNGRPSCDYSLNVLAVLQVLLNLNKTADAIPQTPTVRTVP